MSQVTDRSSNDDANQGFAGLRVVSLESRRSDEVARLVERWGGVAIPAPAMRELPIEENHAALEFASLLLAGTYDTVIFLTGVGTRFLFEAMERGYPREQLMAALSQTTIVARGPKPLRALRDLELPVAVAVPAPNTWREVVAAIEENPRGRGPAGSSIAVQEYGRGNNRLIDALRAHGAQVHSVRVYRWALPENIEPLRSAIRAIIARTVDVVLFTSATQVHHLLELARKEHLEDELRNAARELALCSIGPVCSETMLELGLGVDLQAAHSKLGAFVKEAAAAAAEILPAKRAMGRKVCVADPRTEPAKPAGLSQSPFLCACRSEPTPYTPVWLMRQAGRYMQEYRELRARVPFVELCKNPELAAEVTVSAARKLGTDAAILFSDILLLIEPMGLGLSYPGGEGPSISRVVLGAADVDRLKEVEPEQSLPFVLDAVRRARAELDPSVALIGFAGAPFTLASYILEGGGSRHYVATKSFMYRDEGAWNALMALLARAVARHLEAQIKAGCDAVQLFDSWVGCLAPCDYERYVLPHTRTVLAALPAGTPVIHFGTNTASLLELQVQAGTRVLGVDHRVSIASVLDRFPGVAVQGNLDPVTLFAEPARIRAEAKRILDAVGARPGHIFNLGHGVLPATPVGHVIALVEAVHELSQR